MQEPPFMPEAGSDSGELFVSDSLRPMSREQADYPENDQNGKNY